MKKILLLALCLITISCNTAKDPNKDFNGDVKVQKEFHYDASEKFGEPSIGKLIYLSVWEYDYIGRLVKYESYNDDSGELKSASKFEYNDKGKIVKESSYDKDGKLNNISKFEYNDKGQVAKRSSYDIDGKLKSVIKSEYNDKGKVIKQSSYDSDGEPTIVVTYKYNDNGNMTTMSYFNYDRESESVSEYKYTKFDDEDNWIERECYENNAIFSIAKREFTYW
jgi:hypothetical protein